MWIYLTTKCSSDREVLVGNSLILDQNFVFLIYYTFYLLKFLRKFGGKYFLNDYCCIRFLNTWPLCWNNTNCFKGNISVFSKKGDRHLSHTDFYILLPFGFEKFNVIEIDWHLNNNHDNQLIEKPNSCISSFHLHLPVPFS